MTPDPITPDQAAPFVAWWKVIVSVVVGVPAVLVGCWLISGCTTTVECSCEAESGEECRAVAECMQGGELTEPPVRPEEELLEKRVERLEDE